MSQIETFVNAAVLFDYFLAPNAVDCFDGDGQPVIKHGRTPTQPLNFRQALLSIREHAFFTSP